jgi:hypothetical protein
MRRKITSSIVIAMSSLVVLGGQSPAEASNGHVGTVLFWDANFSGPQAAVECGQIVNNLGTRWLSFSMNDRMSSARTFAFCGCTYFVDVNLGGFSFPLGPNFNMANADSMNDRISSVRCNQAG